MGKTAKILLIVFGAFVVIIGMLVMWFVGVYNTLQEMDEDVAGKWAQVENVYQRRSDLIPNLVNTVKGYADFEQETLTGVIEARSKATAVNIDPSNLSPAAISQFQSAQDGLGSALSRLLVTIERYPDLKANQNFLELQSQLEGTENRIAVERKRFNDAVQTLNAKIRKIPASMIAPMAGVERKGYFEADEGAEKVPEVKF
ncbi:LemA family protein [Fulvivirga lutimaris]|uniref:LemA family protein n=1 Tax=Fulvivirga lutimaris TaxID=1819566 RepID=UPI0012BD15BA|nr:LemA family protein [Fulvivirga lutimaris]MTI41139.1 LemA family protein [Fulvivirga lutimaris]